MRGFDGEHSAGHRNVKFSSFLVKNCKISAVKDFIKKLILLNFVNLSTNFRPRSFTKVDLRSFFQVSKVKPIFLNKFLMILKQIDIVYTKEKHLLIKQPLGRTTIFCCDQNRLLLTESIFRRTSCGVWGVNFGKICNSG